MSQSPSDLDKLSELLKKFRFAMLTTRTDDGKLAAHPLTVQEAEFDRDLWFIIGKNSSAVEDVARDPMSAYPSARMTRGYRLRAPRPSCPTPRSCANSGIRRSRHGFPDGPENPNVTLLKVDAVSGEYWDSPGGRVATLVSLVKSKITGEQFRAENEKLDL